MKMKFLVGLIEVVVLGILLVVSDFGFAEVRSYQNGKEYMEGKYIIDGDSDFIKKELRVDFNGEYYLILCIETHQLDEWNTRIVAICMNQEGLIIDGAIINDNGPHMDSKITRSDKGDWVIISRKNENEDFDGTRVIINKEGRISSENMNSMITLSKERVERIEMGTVSIRKNESLYFVYTEDITLAGCDIVVENGIGKDTRITSNGLLIAYIEKHIDTRTRVIVGLQKKAPGKEVKNPFSKDNSPGKNNDNDDDNFFGAYKKGKKCENPDSNKKAPGGDMDDYKKWFGKPTSPTGNVPFGGVNPVKKGVVEKGNGSKTKKDKCGGKAKLLAAEKIRDHNNDNGPDVENFGWGTGPNGSCNVTIIYEDGHGESYIISSNGQEILLDYFTTGNGDGEEPYVSCDGIDSDGATGQGPWQNGRFLRKQMNEIGKFNPEDPYNSDGSNGGWIDPINTGKGGNTNMLITTQQRKNCKGKAPGHGLIGPGDPNLGGAFGSEEGGGILPINGFDWIDPIDPGVGNVGNNISKR